MRDGRLIKSLFLGSQRIARSAQVGGDFAAEQLYLHNHLGSTELTVSGAGQPQTALSYTPYGELLHEFGDLSETPYRFAGKETDTESALAYFEQRYLNRRWGRFISPDPVLDLEERLYDPQHWAVYSYARGNPASFIDPNGESPISVLAKQTAKVGVKKAAQRMGKRQVRRLKKYMDQAGLKKEDFLQEVDSILETLDSSPLEIAVELIPGVGDIYGAAKFGKDIAKVYHKLQDLEVKWGKKIYGKLSEDQQKAFKTAMRNAGVRDAKADRGIPKTGSGLELHHHVRVYQKPWRASDPRHIEPMTPEAHRELHRREGH